MRALRTVCALLMTLAAAAAPAQEQGGSLWRKLGEPYRPPPVQGNRFEDSQRLGALIRGGQMYLSLDDTIALTVENNLDVAVQRYLPVFAGADVWRTKAGTTTRGIQLTVREGPQGVGGPSSPVLTGGIDNTNSQTDVTLVPGQVPGIGATSFVSGPRLPSFEPTLTGQLGWSHRTVPQTSLFSYGAPYLVTETTAANSGFLRGFSSGAQLSVSFVNNWQRVNTGRVDYNPYTASSLGFTVTQPLLQGFGRDVNQRYIKIARNNLGIADLTFRQQLVATVTGVIRLYYDLVSVTQDLEVKRQALKRAETLLENNRAQVEVGTLAEIELARAQAEVARSRQALTNSESLVLQQEVILKNVVSRKGTADPDLQAARIVPTDRIRIPAREEGRDLNRLVEEAFRDRPDYNQALMQLENARIALKGSKNALLPQLDLVGTMQNNALAGGVNAIPAPGTPPGTPRFPDPQYLGGWGTALGQIFRRNYPDCGIFLQLSIPLSNSQARADMLRDTAQLNQAELRIEQLKHQVRTEVEAALLALERARAAWEAARQTRSLQEDALAAEQERYSVGATTSFFVIQSQRDLAQARSDEVLAESLYAKARTALERATGQVLSSHSIQLDEAASGEVKRPPSPLP